MYTCHQCQTCVANCDEMDKYVMLTVMKWTTSKYVIMLTVMKWTTFKYVIMLTVMKWTTSSCSVTIRICRPCYLLRYTMRRDDAWICCTASCLYGMLVACNGPMLFITDRISAGDNAIASVRVSVCQSVCFHSIFGID